MNREELPRIRLKVATNGGINILCTALRTWKVSDWLPHIEEAYRQVKEDQEGDEDSKKRFIKALRIKKGNFLIANSELIGDIFEDNDQVQCEIQFPQSKQSSTTKKQKKKIKIQQKSGENNDNNKEQSIQKLPLPTKRQKKQSKSQKNQKNVKQKGLQKNVAIEQKGRQQIIQLQQENLKQKIVKPQPQKKSKAKPHQKENNITKQSLFKSVDLVKLKSLLSDSGVKINFESNKRKQLESSQQMQQ